MTEHTHDGRPTAHTGRLAPHTGHDDKPMSPLEPGTVQRGQLRARTADIAWTALCVVLGAWALFEAVGVIRGDTDAWIFCAVAAVLFSVAFWTRLAARKARARTHL